MGNGIYGTNSDRQLYKGACYAEHAETNALSKLIKVGRGNVKRLYVIDLLVIRTDKNLNLKNSKPCKKCIEYMCEMPKYGYKIRHIYYSDKDGDIIRKKLNELCDDDCAYVSRGFR